MAEQNGQKVKQEHRLTSLEVKVDTIMGNHLPHLQKAIDQANSRTWYVLGTVLVGIVLQIYFNL